MSLLGTPVLLLAIVVAVALPIACLQWWNRVRGPRGVRAAQRLALVTSAQVAAVLLVAVVANRYGDFYGSWSELFATVVGPGAAPIHRQTSHVGATYPDPAPADAPSVSPGPRSDAGSDDRAVVGSATSWSTREQWPTRGAIVDTVLHGPVTGLAEDALVYLPPSYFASGARQLPVVEILSGYPGSPQGLVKRLRYPDELLTGITDARMRPMVLVMIRPYVLNPSPWDTECTDVPDGPQSLTYLKDDVPAAVTERFGLAPTSYGAGGDSTGGYCALKLAMVDPGRFRAAASLSGYFKPATDSTTRGIFTGRRSLRQDNDLTWRLRHLPMPATSLYLGTARDEPGRSTYAVQEAFLAEVRAPLSVDISVLDHGGHNFNTWASEVPDALTWLSQKLPTQSLALSASTASTAVRSR